MSVHQINFPYIIIAYPFTITTSQEKEYDQGSSRGMDTANFSAERRLRKIVSGSGRVSGMDPHEFSSDSKGKNLFQESVKRSTRSLVQDEICLDEFSFISKEFKVDALKKNNWPMKLTDFLASLLTKSFLESELNFENLIAIHNSTTFNDEFKGVLKEVRKKPFIEYYE